MLSVVRMSIYWGIQKKLNCISMSLCTIYYVHFICNPLFYYALKKCPFLVHVHVRDHVYIANCNIARKSKKREMKKEKYVWNLLYKKIVSDDVICVLYLFPIYWILHCAYGKSQMMTHVFYNTFSSILFYIYPFNTFNPFI